MINLLYRLFGCTAATAAVETAIFAPIFLTLTLGVTDLGTGMFVQMTANAAAQAGAAYAVRHSCASSCLPAIKTAMNDATGNPSYCTGTVCAASMSPDPCTASSVCIVTVSANYPFTPILHVAGGAFANPKMPPPLPSWTQTQTYSSTVTVRVQ